MDNAKATAVDLRDMAEEIPVGKPLNIRACGHDERWLQDRIEADPTVLGLGDLVLVDPERRQLGGGRLDLLLKNPKDNSMYEVEIMLGATDESHIIRTIEYWDLEKNRWPQRPHTAVLIAETINRRFFNVIQLLSATVPIIAIQANVIEGEGRRMLHFTTILDAYQEPEDEVRDSDGIIDESRWKGRNPATFNVARALFGIVSTEYEKLELVYTRSYIALRRNYNLFWLYPSRERVWLKFYVGESDGDALSSALKQLSIVPDSESTKYGCRFYLRIDEQFVRTNPDLFRKVAEYVRKLDD